MFMQLYVPKIMHEMHFGSDPTLMLALFNLVKTLSSAILYKNRPTSVVHQPVKSKVTVSTQQRSLGMKYMH